MRLAGPAKAWALTGQLVTGWIPFPRRLADGQAIADPARPRLDLGIATLALRLAQGDGAGVDLQLPLGVIARGDIVAGSRADLGLGDLELRGRFHTTAGPLSLAGSGGLALPTGPYAARSGQVGLDENAQYLSLGRGSTWILLDLEARMALPQAFGTFGSATVRGALGPARDGFHWGPEVRGTAGATFGPVFDRLSFALGLEAQWRAQSSEIDLFTAERVPSGNTGGTWLTLTPSAQLRVLDAVAVFASARIPLGQWASGLQFIAGPGVLVGLGGSLEVFGAPPAAAQPPFTPTPGRVTLVDYWATWCEPCARLKPLLEAARRRHPAIEIREVDASTWDAAELERRLPGAAGLPVLELYGRDGRRAARLEGKDVFDFDSVLEELDQ